MRRNSANNTLSSEKVITRAIKAEFLPGKEGSFTKGCKRVTERPDIGVGWDSVRRRAHKIIKREYLRISNVGGRREKLPEQARELIENLATNKYRLVSGKLAADILKRRGIKVAPKFVGVLLSEYRPLKLTGMRLLIMHSHIKRGTTGPKLMQSMDIKRNTYRRYEKLYLSLLEKSKKSGKRVEDLLEEKYRI